ncbi:MAG: single-stranded DNA-binding protein [Oscillatoriales cyanobacterium RU_3_3]|nr:single-stranded DNA-binding protein [Microcoleus sp. SU_5_6]NJM61073.1 single-stranded DNA-binding protein [Oscillatoriales cyanobacterium RU_3_3]NJR21002.1 single-stranded DNA-binding protein [Richelia sp. CSU_2_1]
MNSCILMAEIIQPPQLRYTPDNQLQIAEMLVQFPGPRPEDPPEHLKAIGWGNLAQDIHDKYREGDRVIIEGRLGMNTIERDGVKEKRAELTVQRIYPLGADSIGSVSASEPPQNRAAAPTAAPSNVVPMNSRGRSSNSATAPANRTSNSEWNAQPLNYESDRSSSSSDEPENPDYDPIPF